MHRVYSIPRTVLEMTKGKGKLVKGLRQREEKKKVIKAVNIWIVKLMFLNVREHYLKNRKHVQCFYRLIETRVEVWEIEKCCFLFLSENTATRKRETAC